MEGLDIWSEHLSTSKITCALGLLLFVVNYKRYDLLGWTSGIYTHHAPTHYAFYYKFNIGLHEGKTGKSI